jgi:hypothetical protein
VKAMSFSRRKCLLPDDDVTQLKPEVRLEAFKVTTRV